ncbi:DUF6112 family protein [Rathayibacter soli]|uniref:DUF6112 family protein n=1 Tax=Rathayibacter soli TaxID=3144168 RepID=UPI0027E530E2|nr:DUF6112 family protein [Glaciibacter superstes]
MYLQSLASVAVYPDFSGIGGRGTLTGIVGALLTITLIVAVLMLIVCAIIWATCASHGNSVTASKARTGVWVCLSSAVLAGAGTTWLNFLLSLGSKI